MGFGLVLVAVRFDFPFLFFGGFIVAEADAAVRFRADDFADDGHGVRSFGCF
jgi:hypothetical protein